MLLGIQRIRETENQRNRESEKQRYGDSDATDEAEEFPLLAARIRTLQEAVQATVERGLDSDLLFTFARALKAFEFTEGCELSQDDLDAAFALLWSRVNTQLPQEADFDEYRFQFLESFARTKSPLGANHFEEAVWRADNRPHPPECARYRSENLKRLTAVCYHLQQLAGDQPFFLSARKAAKAARTQNPTMALSFLYGLIRDGVLTLNRKGIPGGKFASRFRYNRLQP